MTAETHQNDKMLDQAQKRKSHEVVLLDELDKKILAYIQDNGKASLRTVAQSVGSSVSAVKNHIDNLSEKGVIKDYVAVLDCCKIGYNEMLLLFIKVNSTVGVQETLLKLEEIPTLNAIYQVSGNQPIFCMAKCIEKNDQIELLEKVKAIPGIDEITTHIVMQKVKEDMRVTIPGL